LFTTLIRLIVRVEFFFISRLINTSLEAKRLIPINQHDDADGDRPITVDPRTQAAGVGPRLMEAVLELGAQARGIRLLQDAFNSASLALYGSLGFEVREPIALLNGRPRGGVAPGVDVRPLRESDVPGAEAHGCVTAYATTLTFFPAAHAVAETTEDMKALLTGALAATDAPGASCGRPARRCSSAGPSRPACALSSR
jgi:GNAT superfamily N-acetyltransferase